MNHRKLYITENGDFIKNLRKKEEIKNKILVKDMK